MNIARSKILMPHRRNGFTLVELVMVIAIMAILGGLALSMIGGARHDANAARTETQIRRITHFIEARLEDYAVRILPYRLSQYSSPVIPVTPFLTRQQIAELRNRILIEYIRAEMPCRLSQVSAPGTPTNNFPSTQFVTDFGTPLLNVVDRANTLPVPPRILLIDDEMKLAPPSLVKRMATKLNAASASNEQAECLFEILNSHNDYASSGMDFIFAAEIKDTDGDGHNEILDAWGDPLQFTLHVRTDEPTVLVPGLGLDTMDPTLIDYMNKEGPLSVHFDVTSVNLPK